MKKLLREKDLDPSMHAHAAGKTVELPTDVDAELLAKGSFKSGNGSTFIYPGQTPWRKNREYEFDCYIVIKW